jgi:hypothetical protein
MVAPDVVDVMVTGVAPWKGPAAGLKVGGATAPVPVPLEPPLELVPGFGPCSGVDPLARTADREQHGAGERNHAAGVDVHPGSGRSVTGREASQADLAHKGRDARLTGVSRIVRSVVQFPLGSPETRRLGRREDTIPLSVLLSRSQLESFPLVCFALACSVHRLVRVRRVEYRQPTRSVSVDRSTWATRG